MDFFSVYRKNKYIFQHTCLRLVCWNLVSDSIDVTVSLTVPPTPGLTGLQNTQEGVKKLLLGNDGKVPGFSSIFPVAGSVIKPETISHSYTDIC